MRKIEQPTRFQYYFIFSKLYFVFIHRSFNCNRFSVKFCHSNTSLLIINNNEFSFEMCSIDFLPTQGDRKVEFNFSFVYSEMVINHVDNYGSLNLFELIRINLKICRGSLAWMYKICKSCEVSRFNSANFAFRSCD